MARRPGRWMSLGLLALLLGSVALPLGLLPGAGLLAWGCIQLRDRSRAFDGVVACLSTFLAAVSWWAYARPDAAGRPAWEGEAASALALASGAALFGLLAHGVWRAAPGRLAARVVRASGWTAAAGFLLAWFLRSWFAREVLGADGGLWGFLLLALGLLGTAAGLWRLDAALREPMRGPMPELPPA